MLRLTHFPPSGIMGGIQKVTQKPRLNLLRNVWILSPTFLILHRQLARLRDEKQRGLKFQSKSVFLTDVMTSVLYQGTAMPNALAFFTACVCVRVGGPSTIAHNLEVMRK